MILFGLCIINILLKSIYVHTNDYLFIHSYSSKPPFVGLENGCLNMNISQGRSYVNSDVDISFCIFGRLSSFEGDGGVISIVGKTFFLYASYTSFSKCSSSGRGGAIFFDSESQIMRYICSNQCYSKNGQFGSFCTNSSNQIEYLSMARNLESGSYGILQQNGKPTSINCNYSMNSGLNYVGSFIFTDEYYSNNYKNCYSTYVNNMAKDSCVLGVQSGRYLIQYVNFVHNISPMGGVILNQNLMEIRYSIFHSNFNILFENNGILGIHHSYVFHKYTITNKNTITMDNNNTLTYTATYKLPYFQKEQCYADIPVLISSPYPTFTIMPTNIQTPYDTPPISPDFTNINTPQNTPDPSSNHSQDTFLIIRKYYYIGLIIILFFISSLIWLSTKSKFSQKNMLNDDLLSDISSDQNSLWRSQI